MQDAQDPVDAQPDVGVHLGPVDDGVIGPEAQPIVGDQGGNVVAQEKEDAQEGDEKSDGLHVVPVHGQLDLEATREQPFYTGRPPRVGARAHTRDARPPGWGASWEHKKGSKSAADQVKVSAPAGLGFRELSSGVLTVTSSFSRRTWGHKSHVSLSRVQR